MSNIPLHFVFVENQRVDVHAQWRYFGWRVEAWTSCTCGQGNACDHDCHQRPSIPCMLCHGKNHSVIYIYGKLKDNMQGGCISVVLLTTSMICISVVLLVWSVTIILLSMSYSRIQIDEYWLPMIIRAMLKHLSYCLLDKNDKCQYKCNQCRRLMLETLSYYYGSEI